MTYEQIASAIVEEAIATDAAETAVHGERRGDELPEIVGRRGPRRLAARRAPAARPATRGAGPSRSRARAPTRLLEAKRRLEEELALEREANANFEAYRAARRDARRAAE